MLLQQHDMSSLLGKVLAGNKAMCARPLVACILPAAHQVTVPDSTAGIMLQVMIRAGFTDSALDEEARQLVAAAEAVRVADHGAESVLLLAVQAELEEVSAARQQMEAEVQQLRDR
jgi:hypothetical protein